MISKLGHMFKSSDPQVMLGGDCWKFVQCSPWDLWQGLNHLLCTINWVVVSSIDRSIFWYNNNPTVTCGICMCELWPILTHTLQHGHCMWIHLGMNIGLFIWESACKATCCLLSRRIFLFNILRIEVQTTKPPKNEVFKMN